MSSFIPTSTLTSTPTLNSIENNKREDRIKNRIHSEDKKTLVCYLCKYSVKMSNSTRMTFYQDDTLI